MATIIIEDWMIEEEGLSGVQLLAFALIHGCTQKGEGCWYGGYDKLAKRVGSTQRTVINSVNTLVESGKIERCDGLIDGKLRKVLRSVINNSEQISDEKISDENSSHQGVKKFHYNSEKISYPSNNIEIKDKNKPVFSPEVEQLYALYPTKCPKSGRGTDKGIESKKIIVRLLKKISSQEIVAAIRAYLDDCDKTDTFIKNFDTLLHKIEKGEVSGDLFHQEQEPEQEPVVYYHSLEELEAARRAKNNR